VIEVDADSDAISRCGSARKIVQEPEQVESLFSGTLIAAKSVCDADRLPAASVNSVSLIHGIHEADVVSIVVAGVNPKFV
jgi:hypothetical protein